MVWGWLRRLASVWVAITFVMVGTTTASATTFTYDTPTIARVGAYAGGGSGGGSAQFRGAREAFASPSGEARGTSTTPPVASVATNTAGALEEAASRRVTVLGRFRGGTEEFLGKPGFNVLDLPSRGTGRWYWSRNKAFMDDAIAAGDEIRLVTNPFEPIYSGGNTFQRELRYLKDLGYRFEEAGDHWVAVPGR